jgi:heptosyltransferase-2
VNEIAFRAPNWLGDCVLATVVPPSLKRARPEARLTVLVPLGLGEVFSRSPHVDSVIELDRSREVDAYRRGRYDFVLLAPNSWGAAWRARRGGVHEVYGFATSGRGFLLRKSLPKATYRRDRHQVENYRALASLAGELERECDTPRVFVDPLRRKEARDLWPDAGGPRVALQPGAAYGPAKRWPAERYAELAGSLAREGCSIALLGGPDDEGTVAQVRKEAPVEFVDLCGRTPVGLLAAILEEADLVVTNDTGPMHLAAAVGTRTLALFGSTSPTWTGPFGEGHHVLRHPVPCAPCFRRTCRIGYLCFAGIRVDSVAEEVLRMLGEVRP